MIVNVRRLAFEFLLPLKPSLYLSNLSWQSLYTPGWSARPTRQSIALSWTLCKPSICWTGLTHHTWVRRSMLSKRIRVDHQTQCRMGRIFLQPKVCLQDTTLTDDLFFAMDGFACKRSLCRELQANVDLAALCLQHLHMESLSWTSAWFEHREDKG